MSRDNLSSSFHQETGRIGADGQNTQFGPANREFYDRDKWAMVPAGMQQTSEIVPDVDIAQQRHTPGEPRLLKHLPEGDYLPNLLTICHAINTARRALLMLEHTQMSYGQDGDWWKGHPIAMTKIVNVVDGSAAEPEPEKYDELLTEVQRLMAFMSASDRSYASVGALTQTEVLKTTLPTTTRSRTMLEVFLQNWIVAATTKSGTPSDITDLFITTVGTNAEEGMDTPDMSLIDMQVNIDEGAKSELSELLDGLLWDTDAENTTMSDNYIERPANVLVMRVYQANATTAPQLRVEAPAEFYVDKYLPENIEATRATRVKMATGKKRIAKIEEIKKKLKRVKHPKKNEELDSSLLLKHTLGHFSGQNRMDVINADKISTVPEEMKANKPGYDELAQKLENIIASIDNKLTLLAEEKETTRKAISAMSKAPPPGLEQDDLKHRYTLRGVATRPNITYVLCPTESESNDEMLEEDTTPQGMRWWRMEYEVNASGSGAKVTKTKTPDYDVIRAVELEHSSALLVYASDAANASLPDDDTLPAPLQEFVERDSYLFSTEVQAELNKSPAFNFSNEEPIQTIERTSIDSTRVEGGGSDDGMPSPPSYNDPMFFGHAGYGLGPDIKQGYRQDEDDAPVHEIKLDPPDDEGLDMGTEMVEKPHESSLVPGLGAGGSDDAMEDIGQEHGVGGATYVEDAKMK